MRRSLGFTGTPIEKTDANPRAAFGDYISIYDIQRAASLRWRQTVLSLSTVRRLLIGSKFRFPLSAVSFSSVMLSVPVTMES